MKNVTNFRMSPILVLVLFLLSVPLALSAWGATGNVAITSPTVSEFASGFTITGTYNLVDDDFPKGIIANNGILGDGCTAPTIDLLPYSYEYAAVIFATLEYKLDDVWRRQMKILRTLPINGPFSQYVDITGLDPTVSHYATVYLKDVYGARCVGQPFYKPVGGSDIAKATFAFTINTPCNLQISTFTKDKAVFDPHTQTVGFSGTISETSYRSVSWSLIIKDDLGNVKRTLNGSGKSPSASWNGKDEDGHVVPDGVYTATLSAWTNDNKCSQSRDIEVAVHSLCIDRDGDGYFAIDGVCPLGEDCNDNPDDNGQLFHPGAPELCDNKDNDCDGQVDEPKFVDADRDTYYGSQIEGCPVEFERDCKDDDPAVNPGTLDLCGDLIDNNCNGQTDENCSSDCSSCPCTNIRN